jgi:hypothetical protein
MVYRGIIAVCSKTTQNSYEQAVGKTLTLNCIKSGGTSQHKLNLVVPHSTS